MPLRAKELVALSLNDIERLTITHTHVLFLLPIGVIRDLKHTYSGTQKKNRQKHTNKTMCKLLALLY